MKLFRCVAIALACTLVNPSADAVSIPEVSQMLEINPADAAEKLPNLVKEMTGVVDVEKMWEESRSHATLREVKKHFKDWKDGGVDEQQLFNALQLKKGNNLDRNPASVVWLSYLMHTLDGDIKKVIPILVDGCGGRFHTAEQVCFRLLRVPLDCMGDYVAEIKMLYYFLLLCPANLRVEWAMYYESMTTALEHIMSNKMGTAAGPSGADPRVYNWEMLLINSARAYMYDKPRR